MTTTQAQPAQQPRSSTSAEPVCLWTRGRRFAVVLVAAWALLNASALVRGLLPAPLGHPMPWGMFKTASSEYRTVGAYGITPGGERVALPLEQHFRYSRGSTALRVYDVPRVLLKADRRTQARLAEWLAARAGAQLAYVSFYVDVHDIDTGDVTTVRLGQFRVGDRAR